MLQWRLPMTRPGFLLRVLATQCLLMLGAGVAFAQGVAQRHALVIGNDSYRHVERLVNSRSDARAMAQALERSGFRVRLHTDLDLNGMKAAMRTFKAQVSGGDEAIFFFAGHGVEIENVSYLMPTDIRGDDSDQVKDDAIALQRVLDDMREKRARFTLAIVDACRNNPFQGTGRSIGGGRGLAPTAVATGQMVLYSAGVGQIALDTLGPGDGVKNGVFTRVLLREMAKPGVEVGEVMRSVREEVAALAKTVGREQVPALYDQRLGRFYFQVGQPSAVAPVAPVAPTVPPMAAPAPAVNPVVAENQLWTDARSIGNREAYEAYLSVYPTGRFAPMARAAIARLAQPAPVAGAQVATPPARATPGSPGTVIKDCDACPEMVAIPGGSFLMGSPPGQGDADERPQRRVTIAPFAMGRTEVTQAQWFAVMGTRPSWFKGDDLPVEQVSWDDAQDFVRRLSTMTGRRYRLPSEAEWEYAARAGSQGAYSFGDDASQLGRHAWFGANSNSRTQPVGRKQANAYGLYDMHGNVWEWVEDCWNGNYAGAPADGRAWTSGDCGRRVVRGGSWNDFPALLRAAIRSGYTSSYRSDNDGFRVARTD